MMVLYPEYTRYCMQYTVYGTVLWYTVGTLYGTVPSTHTVLCSTALRHTVETRSSYTGRVKHALVARKICENKTTPEHQTASGVTKK